MPERADDAMAAGGMLFSVASSMSNYGTPRKFRSRYKTYHRQAAGHASTWNHWVGRTHSDKSARSVVAWIVLALIVLSSAWGAIYAFAVR